MLRALKHEDDFVRLLCFSVWSLRRTSGSCKWAWIASNRRVWFRVWGWRADFRRRSSEEEESVKARSKESSHGCSSELVPVFSTMQVFVISVAHFPSVYKGCRNDSGNFRKWCCVDWRADWWTYEGASHSCCQEPGTVGWGARAWCPRGCPQSKSEQRIVGAGVWWWQNLCSKEEFTSIVPYWLQIFTRFVPFRSVRHRSCCHCDSCHCSSDGVLASLCLRGGESTTAVSFDEKLVPVASIWFKRFSVWCTICASTLTGLNEALDRLNHGPSQGPQRVETSETSGDETDTSKGRQKILSKETFRVRKAHAATELGRFFVTGPSDAAKMPSYFYCRVCWRNISVLTLEHHEMLRHFQGSHHFDRKHRLHLETPKWHVLYFHGIPLNEDELKRQKGKIKKAPLVVRDREHPFAEDLITVEAGVVDPQLPVLTNCSASLMRWGWEAARTGWEAVDAVRANRLASQHWGSMDSRRSFGRFRKFPESLHFIPDLHCCFAFSQSS